MSYDTIFTNWNLKAGDCHKKQKMNCINENIKKILTIVEPDAYLADLYKVG